MDLDDERKQLMKPPVLGDEIYGKIFQFWFLNLKIITILGNIGFLFLLFLLYVWRLTPGSSVSFPRVVP